MIQDVTSKIERLEALEERLSISLSSLSAFFAILNDGRPCIQICGEFHSGKGMTLVQTIYLHFAIYDLQGRVVTSEYCMFLSQSFYGMETFQKQIFPPTGELSKIRIYPGLH